MKIGMNYILALLLLALTSCVHRNFEYDNGRIGYVEVVFDWRNAPDAQPASMSLYLFPQQGGEPLRYEFVGRNGGVIRVAPGTYDAICINSDKRDVLYRGAELFSTFEVTTPEADNVAVDPLLDCRSSDLPVAPGTEDQKIMMQPPMLWSSSETGFTVTVTANMKGKAGKGMTEIEHQVLTMYPKRIVDTYVVTVKNVRNVQYLRTLSGSISDMSEGYMAAEQMRTDTSVILPFGLTHDVAQANAEGMFLTFGHCPDVRRSHKLMLYAVLTDGSKYYYEFDVSDQAHNPPDDNGIYHIVVEFIDIPNPSGGGSGVSPDVNTWNSVDIYLDM